MNSVNENGPTVQHSYEYYIKLVGKLKDALKQIKLRVYFEKTDDYLKRVSDLDLEIHSIFGNYSAENIGALAREVEHFTISADRDSSEFHYLKKFDAFVSTVNKLEASHREGALTNFLPSYLGQPDEVTNEELEKDYYEGPPYTAGTTAAMLHHTIDSFVTSLCFARDKAASVARRSLLVANKPGEFPNLVIRTEANSQLTTEADQAPTEPGVKLQWNGSKEVLYNLFAELMKVDLNGKGNMLIGNSLEGENGVAQFLKDSIEGLPDVATIATQLRRHKNGLTTVKKNQIELIIKKE